MKLQKTGFDGLILISHNINTDNRGFFKESFKKNSLEKMLKYEVDFCQENVVHSKINSLRGLHYQINPYAQSKLISIYQGSIFDVAVDLRKKSETYGKFFSRVISAENHESLFIPKGFAHGYLTLTNDAIVNYKVDNYYNPTMERGISYNDNFLNIDWGVDKNQLIISEKDKGFNSFRW